MNQCSSCSGLVPDGQTSCPNCNAGPKWWRWPLAIAGAGFATVTLSACYGPACASTITLPDGGVTTSYSGICGESYDCREPIADGGVRENDPTWASYCVEAQQQPEDAGTTSDGGVDAGP